MLPDAIAVPARSDGAIATECRPDLRTPSRPRAIRARVAAIAAPLR
jgi:hypothetical protein